MANKNTGRVVVTGAGGFIGHHLVSYLKSLGHWVRGVDIKYPDYETTMADEFIIADLRFFESCGRAVENIGDVYNLAADMGGIGYITTNHAILTRNNTLINNHMLEAARLEGVERYLYTSSACVYPSFLQHDADVTPLREEQAVPADPEKGYGWEKLFAEQLTTYYHEECDLDVRIVRFHNIYGPLGTYEGGKEKAPAAICRKVAEAKNNSEIEVWGDGEQTRSFCHVDDCTEGMVRLMNSGFVHPLNLGTDEIVTVNQLVDMVCDASGKSLAKIHDLTKPQGVRGRNSDNSLLREVLGWEPRITLKEGIGRTYKWIWSELARQDRANPPNRMDSRVRLGQP
jgi:GDP-D-mannose 3',5'-epimerase